MKRYEKLYRYCTSTKVHGAVYKARLKELQQLTLKGLLQCRNIKKYKR